MPGTVRSVRRNLTSVVRALRVAALAAALAAGCMQTDQRFVLNADGSGSLEAEITLIPQAVRAIEAMRKMPGRGQAELMASVPLTEEDIRALGDGKGVTVTFARVERTGDGGATVSFRLEFTDVQAFAASSAREYLNFELERAADGKARFTTPLGMSRNMLVGAGRGAERGGEESEAALEMMKLVARGATCRMEATLPGRVGESNATEAAASRAVWRWEVDRLQMQDLTQELPGGEKRIVGAWAEVDPAGIAFKLPVRMRRPLPFEPVAEAEPAEPPPPGEVRFRAEPATATILRQVEFKDGKPEKVTGSLTFRLRVLHPAGVIPVSYTCPEVEHALADTGEDLAQERGRRREYEQRIWSSRRFLRRGTAEEPHFRVSVPLRRPDSPVKSFSRLKGSFKVKYAARIRKVEFSRPRDRVGKWLDMEGLEDAEILLEKMEKDSLALRVGRETEARMGEVRFLDGAGRQMALGGSSSKGGRDYTTRTYRLTLPDDGKIVFTMYEDLRQEPVTFDFMNLSLGGKAEVEVGRGAPVF